MRALCARGAGPADVNLTLPMWNAKLEDGRRALKRPGAFMRRWVR